MEMQGFRGYASVIVALLFAAALFATPHRAEASPPPSWNYSLLYTFNFCGAPCGVNVPSSGVTVAPGGSLLGTTCGGGTEGDGGVYQLSPGARGKWKAKVLSDFTVTDPGCPDSANLLLSRRSTSSGPGMPARKTVYYGTTPGDGGESSCGTVFELFQAGSAWHMTTIYSFQNDGDGCTPNGIIEDTQGHLYGMTAGVPGTVFELADSGSGWTLNTLYAFTGGDDGSVPVGNPLLDNDGNLYGTTAVGGSEGCGTIFELSSAQILSVLHNFCTSPDVNNATDFNPTSGLLMDGTGNLYGVTYGVEGSYPGGIVYKLKPDETFETLYTFCSLANCVDGANPLQTGLVMDKSGNLYGNTYFGGADGQGTVFELTSGGQEIVLHSFTDSESGYPAAPLIFDQAGNILGTTSSSGSVFKLKRH